MKLTTLAVTAALVCAVTAYEHENDHHDHHDHDEHHHHTKSKWSLKPGVQIATKPPVVIIETVTRTTSLAAHQYPHHTHKPHWNDKKYKHKNKGGKFHAAAIKSTDAADAGIEAAEVSGAADNLAAAQASVSPTTTAVTPARSSVASKVSSVVASASASARASASGAENVRTGGTFVAAAAGIAAYLLL